MNKLATLLLVCTLAIPVFAEDKKAPEMTAAEVHTAERLADMYDELARQMAEAQTRVKVLQEMQQKLMNEFNAFQTTAVTARGYKSGEAILDLQQRKVTPAPAPSK